MNQIQIRSRNFAPQFFNENIEIVIFDKISAINHFLFVAYFDTEKIFASIYKEI